MAERIIATVKKSEEKKKCSNFCKQDPGLNSSGFSADRILQLQRTAGNQAVKRLIKSRALQAKLKIGQPNDAYEQEADRVAEQVMRMPDPVPQRKCAKCNKDEKKVLQTEELPRKELGTRGQDVPPIVQDVLSSPGQPLDSSTRAFMETRFGNDFSGVRVHTDTKAAESARAVNALAYTVGRDMVYGAGQYEPDTGAGRKLMAHELTHVVQQSRGGDGSDLHLEVQHDESAQAEASIADQSQILVSVSGKTPVKIARQSMDPRHARGYGGEQSMGFGYSKEKGWILVEGPSGAAGHGITTKGFDGVAYNSNADELHLIDNKSLKAETARSATAITKNLEKNLDALIRKVEGIHDIPKKPRILQLLKEMRNNIALGKKIPKNTKLVVTGEGGRVKGVSASLQKQGVEFLEPGTTDLPPAATTTPPKSAPVVESPTPPPKLAPAEKPPEVGSKVIIETPPTPKTSVPPTGTPPKPISKTIGEFKGIARGISGFTIPLILGWIHQKAVEKRVQEQAKKEGYVPYGAPSGEGLLYDIGAWLIDPGNEADKAVGIDNRFNFPVWREHIRSLANAKKPGEILQMRWDIGKCQFDLFGRQVIEQREVVYRKQADGKWKVESGNADGTPDLNDILSSQISDSKLKALIMTNPCSA